MMFQFGKPALTGAVPEDHVLQLALAAFVANGAIQRVIREQHFEHALASLHNLRRICFDYHSLRDRQRAGGQQFGGFLNLNQAHTAGGLETQPLVVTERGYLDAGSLGRIDQQRSGRGRNLPAINCDVYVSHLFLRTYRTRFFRCIRRASRICSTRSSSALTSLKRAQHVLTLGVELHQPALLLERTRYYGTELSLELVPELFDK